MRFGVKAVGVTAGAVAALGALAVRPTVRLVADQVEVDAGPEQVIANLRDWITRSEGVIARGDHSVVCRFSGRAGPFRYATVEVVTFEPSAITFEHLRGPFAACHERFDLTRTDTGTRLVHTGTCQRLDVFPAGGLWTWPFARLVVRGTFERHVREHLHSMREHLAATDVSRL